jgi:hypothetical protein
MFAFGASALMLSYTGQAIAAGQGLYISEIAANYRETGVAWVELFNNSTQPISLSNYMLRSHGLDFNAKAVSGQPVTFVLPSIDVPPKGYFVLAGKVSTSLLNSNGSAYITDTTGRYVPYWTDSGGFVELLDANGITADFVRFGADKTDPVTAKAWSGDNVPAFRTVPDYFASRSLDPLDNYDRSIVRLTANFKVTRSNEDWTGVAFPTPGGPNDVRADAVDTDKDGIPNTAKVKGGTFAGLDLYKMGARLGQRDLFIHVDYMGPETGKAVDLALVPQAESLQKVLDVFKRHKIQVHFDVGNLFTSSEDPAKFNLSGNLSHEKQFSKCTEIPDPAHPQNCRSLYEFSSSSPDVRRRPIFRYMLLASSQIEDGGRDSSGIAELPGNKFEISLGQWQLSAVGGKSKNMLVNFQAATIMHELGHTIGLRHGGFEHANLKPNYFSVMNYLYQLEGLPLDGAGIGPTQRYYFRKNRYLSEDVPGHAARTYNRCDEPDGPCGTNFKIDYSDGKGKSLDESALLETLNIGRGSNAGAFGDWNLNGSLDRAAYDMDLSGGGGSRRVLKDSDDWSQIVLVTGRSYPKVPGRFFAPVPAEIIKEEAPPTDLVNDILLMKEQRQ